MQISIIDDDVSTMTRPKPDPIPDLSNQSGSNNNQSIARFDSQSENNHNPPTVSSDFYDNHGNSQDNGFLSLPPVAPLLETQSEFPPPPPPPPCAGADPPSILRRKESAVRKKGREKSLYSVADFDRNTAWLPPPPPPDTTNLGTVPEGAGYAPPPPPVPPPRGR